MNKDMLRLFLAVGVWRACLGTEVVEGYPPAIIPPIHLPQYDASQIPGFVPVFRNGECDADDFGIPPTRINVDKACYSCFRIPSLTRNPKTGTLHAFAEARRRGLHSYHNGHEWNADNTCPDEPDTHVAYKRSVDGGKSWSSLRILGFVKGQWQAQASPVVDNTTGKLIVLFNGDITFRHSANIMTSSDDGLTFTAPVPMVGAPGTRLIILSTNGARGHVVTNGSATRLLYPSQDGSLYSDDHGATWSIGPTPVGMCGRSNCMGESAIARCTSGAACHGKKFVMVNRCVVRAPTACMNMAYSPDGVHWDPPVVLNVTGFATASAAPGAVGVPGALVMSHNGGPAGGNTSKRGETTGMDLLYSEDGVTWNLLKRLWPLIAGYSTMAELETDADGAALSYGTIFEAGIIESVDYLAFMNFTWSKPTHASNANAVLV